LEEEKTKDREKVKKKLGSYSWLDDDSTGT